jgi:biotin transporter BioY
MTDAQVLSSIGILGVISSVILEWITAKFGPKMSRLLTIITAMVIGTIFTLYSGTEWLATIIGILMSASTVYSFFIKK